MNTSKPTYEELESQVINLRQRLDTCNQEREELKIKCTESIDSQAKAELLAKTNELEHYFNYTLDLLCIADFDGYFRKLNPEWGNTLGYPVDELINKKFIDFVHPDDVSATLDKLSELNREVQVLNFTNRYLHENGTYRWIEWRSFPCGNVIYAVARDITERIITEQKLREQQERLNLFIKNLPVVAYAIDKNGVFTISEGLGLKKLGLQPGQVVGLSAYDVYKGNDTIINDIKKTLEGEPSHSITIIGNSVYEAWYSAVTNENNEITGLVGAAIDITERNTSEKALAESEERYKLISQLTTDYIFKLKVNHKGTFDVEYISENYYKITGRSEDDIGSILRWNEFIHPDDIDNLVNFVSNTLKTGKASSIEARSMALNSMRWIQIHSFPQVDESTGKVCKILGAVKDINNEKIALEKIKESEEKFRTLFENITEGVAIHEVLYDAEGNGIDYRLTDVNPAYKIHTGIGNEVVGKLGTMVYGTEIPPYMAEFGGVARTRIPYRFETFFPPLNKHFLISVVSPKKGHFATVFEDITERKKREDELRHKNEELERFIYTVSHDLKSPLVTIKAFTSYLTEDIAGNDYDAIKKDICYVQNAADKMGILLEELLELSRIGRKENPRQEVSLKSVVQAAADLVAGRLSQRNIQLSITQAQVTLCCDRQRMVQLFQNLLDNSAKFMGNQTHPLIEVGVDKIDQKHVIFVRDNGSGIDNRYKHKLFGLFEKLDANSDGTGIGLALVKRIVETHNGTIWVESGGVGKGTTFFFTIENVKLS